MRELGELVPRDAHELSVAREIWLGLASLQSLEGVSVRKRKSEVSLIRRRTCPSAGAKRVRVRSKAPENSIYF